MTCPKCGSDGGWRGPQYQGPKYLGIRPVTMQPVYGHGSLIFACLTCGYERMEPTKDAPPEPPPPPRAWEWDTGDDRPWWRRWFA